MENKILKKLYFAIVILGIIMTKASAFNYDTEPTSNSNLVGITEIQQEILLSLFRVEYDLKLTES